MQICYYIFFDTYLSIETNCHLLLTDINICASAIYYYFNIYLILRSFSAGLTITLKSKDPGMMAVRPSLPFLPFPLSHLSTLRAISSHQHLLDLQVS